jgi:hypothetical protein
MTGGRVPKWFPFPRYRDVRLAAELGCGHIVWAPLVTGWPQELIGNLHCPFCDAMGEIGQWWFVQ